MSIEDIRKRADSVITVSEFVSPRTAAIITELCGDRLTLLAEVDRLTATPYPEDDIKAERARILAAVEADWLDTGPWQNYNGFETNGDPYRRVIAAIKGRRRDPS